MFSISRSAPLKRRRRADSAWRRWCPCTVSNTACRAGHTASDVPRPSGPVPATAGAQPAGRPPQLPLASRARRRSSGSPGAARSSAARRRRRRPGQHHRQRHHISVAPETASAWACEGRRRSHPLGVSRREALVMWPPADRQSRRHQHSVEDHHRVSSLSLIRGDLHHVSSPTLPRSFGMASLPDAPHGRWRTGCLSRSPRCCCHRAMS